MQILTDCSKELFVVVVVVVVVVVCGQPNAQVLRKKLVIRDSLPEIHQWRKKQLLDLARDKANLADNN